MKHIKVFLLGLYPLFEYEDLIWAILKNRFSVSITQKPQTADLIILGPFYPSNLNIRIRLKGLGLLKNKFINTSQSSIRKLIKNQIDPNNSRVWIHISGEAPGFTWNSSFFNSECNYGIGHEALINKYYVYMPHWY
jgi:hypothetical protein